ncbi:hypothetical protein B0H12DRAFT_1076840 [Mycena haematopus]|nr:hypothetical protein B0H12DRAFT_1076840 [Mycena haematopus]
MSDLCSNIDALLELHEKEAAAVKRLKDRKIPFGPNKRRKGKSSSSKESKEDKDKEDERLSTPDAEDAFMVEMMRGFAPPEQSWSPILTEFSLHSNQKVSIRAATAAAAAAVPGQPISLLAAESQLFSLVRTTRADAYAAGRVVLCETIATNPAWNAMSNAEKAVHNRELFMVQNPRLFAEYTTNAQKHKTLTRHGKHEKAMKSFLRNEREPLSRTRNQVYNFARVFGLSAIIHPAASMDTLGRHTPSLSLVSQRLHNALEDRADLRLEIKARAAGNLEVILELLAAVVSAWLVHSKTRNIQIKHGTFSSMCRLLHKGGTFYFGMYRASDQEYLDGLSNRQLMGFREYLFSPAFIALNAAKFLDHEWVDIALLKEYLQHTNQNPAVPDPVRVKIEAPQPPVVIKAEPQVTSLPQSSGDIKMRAVEENGKQVFELLSDSEPDADGQDGSIDKLASQYDVFVLEDRIEFRAKTHSFLTSASFTSYPTMVQFTKTVSQLSRSELLSAANNFDLATTGNVTTLRKRVKSHIDLEVIEALQHMPRSSSTISPSDADQSPGIDHDFDAATRDAPHSNREAESCDESELVESDTVWQDPGTSLMRIGKFRPTQKTTVERMEYREGPASIYPIHRVRTGIVIDLSDPKYWFRDPDTKQLYSLDSIILNADNDSWDWGGGGARASAKVTFGQGRTPSTADALALDVKLVPGLRSVVRFELDPVQRNAVLAAQQDTRRREGNTPEERVALFITVIPSREVSCRRLQRQEVPREHRAVTNSSSGAAVGPQNSGRATGRTASQIMWMKIFSQRRSLGLPLTDDPSRDTPPCSGLIHPHTGLKKKRCPHAHILHGMQVEGRIENYPCEAKRYAYIPKDSSIRKVLLIHNLTPHNHPMPALIKMSFELEDTYRECIDANGVLGATVSKIDNAQSTKQLLNGKTPAVHAPPLQNKRVKQDLLRAKKMEKYPNGLGVEAIFPIYQEELTKPLPERYIHSYIKTAKGEIIIVTFVPYLLKLLDDPGSEGDLNEWELTIFAKLVQRAASLLRAYINGVSADFFELLFDELQRVKLMVTGKPIPLKTFVRGGNLLVTNVDMDAAQVLGLCRSALKYSDPEYSGIPKDTPPEKVAPKFIKICWRHGKDLGIEKITNWWKHKEMHEWIIPCIVKSQSLIPADVWDATPSTTNTNEAQHHWTNSLVGIKLTPVEGTRKFQIDMEAEKRRASNALTKNLKEQLKAAKGTSGKQGKSKATASILSASSSGRVRQRGTGRVFLIFVPLAEADNNLEAPRCCNAVRVGQYFTRCCGFSPATQSGQPASSILPELDSARPTVGSALDFSAGLDFDFDFDSLLSELEDTNTPFFAQDVPNAELSTFNAAFDPTWFALPAEGLGALMPLDFGTSNSGTPAPDPLDELLNLYAYSGVSSVSATSNFGSTTSSHDTLPLLPPPPPESPLPAPAADEQVSNRGPSAPKSRRSRQEVDETNILHSTRSRVPTTRKRIADEDSEVHRAQKKSRGGKWFMSSITEIFSNAGSNGVMGICGSIL